MTPKRTKLWRRLAAFLSQLENEKELEKVLDALLTFEEKEMLIDRMLIFEALFKGEKTQRELAKDLEISISKITRGANALKGIPEDVKNLLKRF